MIEFTKIKGIKDIEKVLSDFSNVIATEKIDGTQSRFGLVMGEFKVGSRNCLIGPNERVTDNHGFYAWAAQQEQNLRERYPNLGDIIIVGEWYGAGIQSKIKYCEDKRFMVFDVCICGYWLSWDNVVDVATNLGYDVVPVLYEGPFDKEAIRPLTIADSTVAARNGFPGQTTEGVVIRTKNVYFDNQGERVVGKFKNPAFEELKSAKEGRTVAATPANVSEFVEEWVTDNRLDHVLGHLGDNPNIGDILKEMSKDVQEEADGKWQQVAEDAGLLSNGKPDWKPFAKEVTNKTKQLMRDKGLM
jgi:Rnl2 family RNA ligase